MTGKQGGIIRLVATFAVLSGIWLLWSGITDNPLILGFGVASVLGVMAVSSRMDRVAEAGRSYRLGLRPLLYLPWLVWQIVIANIDVARIILNPKLPISPRLISAPANQKTVVGQVMYANSITLTPGTLSTDVREGEIEVHALTQAAMEDLKSDDRDRRVSATEAAPHKPAEPTEGER